eukprot:6942950-Prymnesium_polylepis.1
MYVKRQRAGGTARGPGAGRCGGASVAVDIGRVAQCDELLLLVLDRRTCRGAVRVRLSPEVRFAEESSLDATSPARHQGGVG